MVEIFYDASDLDWLVTVGEPLLKEEYTLETWDSLACSTLNLLKLKLNSETVISLYQNTKQKKDLPTVC